MLGALAQQWDSVAKARGSLTQKGEEVAKLATRCEQAMAECSSVIDPKLKERKTKDKEKRQSELQQANAEAEKLHAVPNMPPPILRPLTGVLRVAK